LENLKGELIMDQAFLF